MMAEMTRSLTRAEVREIDRRASERWGLPGAILMENAGRSAVEMLLAKAGAAESFAIICGKGNNAGDGFVMARHLQNRGRQAHVLLAAPAASFTGDAAIFFRVIEKMGVPIHDLSAATPGKWRSAIIRCRAAWIIDAIMGTGLTGPIREPFATAVAAINASNLSVFAVDLPSGLDCDTGEPTGACVKATCTGTFVARKVGFDNPASKSWTGDVQVLEIGVPFQLIDEV